jgi:hypothetical protein
MILEMVNSSNEFLHGRPFLAGRPNEIGRGVDALGTTTHSPDAGKLDELAVINRDAADESSAQRALRQQRSIEPVGQTMPRRGNENAGRVRRRIADDAANFIALTAADHHAGMIAATPSQEHSAGNFRGIFP